MHAAGLTETYNREALAAHGIDVTFALDNHSLLTAAFTWHELRLQTQLREQGKLGV